MTPFDEYLTGRVLFQAARDRRYIPHDVIDKTGLFSGYGPKALQKLLADTAAGLRQDRRQFRYAVACTGLALLALRGGIAYYHGDLEFVAGVLFLVAWVGLIAWVAYVSEQ